MFFKKDSFVVEGIKEFKKCSSPVKRAANESVEVDGDFNDENMNPDIPRYLDEEFEEFTMPEEETDGFKYVLGFVAHKFKVKYPFFCSMEKENNWVSMKDRGGLKHMHKDYFESFVQLEYVFRNIHLQTLYAGREAVVTLTEMAGYVKNIPEDVKEFFFRCRVYFRIKALNKALFLEKTRKKIQKMKKIAS